MSSFEVRVMEEDEFKALYNKHKVVVFEEDHSYDLWELLSESELDNFKSLGRDLGSPYKLYLGVFDDSDEFVGWSWGFQENSANFYMCNSAVLPAYRRRGVYSKLLSKCTETLREKGFQLIYSRHCATNNAVIIPKLKAGFIISKMEIDDKFGVMIHLHYYVNKTRKKIMDYRAGQLKPDSEIKRIFKLS